MKTQTFRNRLNAIETEIANYFSELRSKQSKITLFNIDDLENDIPDTYFEVRNDVTGNVFDVFVLEITDKGILVVESENTDTFHTIGLYDFSSIVDRINLVELIEEII